jgi:hypothetical protein
MTAYLDEALFSPNLKLFSCVAASETPESFLLLAAAPWLGWNNDVMLNCSVAILLLHSDRYVAGAMEG